MDTMTFATISIFLLVGLAFAEVFPPQNLDMIERAINDDMMVRAFDEKPGIMMVRAFDNNPADRPGQATDTSSCNTVGPVPEELRSPTNMWPEGLLDFYQQYTEVYGIPIIGPSGTSEYALKRVCYIMKLLFADHYALRNQFYKLYGRFAVIPPGMNITDAPDFRNNGPDQNGYAGVSAGWNRPCGIVREGYVMCDRSNMDTAVHEMAHTLHLDAAGILIPGFNHRLGYLESKTIDAGKSWWGEGSIGNTHYWTGAVESYFGANKASKPGPEALKKDDPELAEFLDQLFTCKNHYINQCSCLDSADNHEMKMNCGYKGPGECYVAGTPFKEYKGKMSVTASGYECEYWDAKNPIHTPWSYILNDDFYPDGSISAAKNYCRDPDGSGGSPWCYTTSKDKKWEQCYMPLC